MSDDDDNIKPFVQRHKKEKVDQMANLREVIDGENYKEWVLFAVTDEGYYSLSYSIDLYRASWLLDRAKEMTSDWDGPDDAS